VLILIGQCGEECIKLLCQRRPKQILVSSSESSFVLSRSHISNLVTSACVFNRLMPLCSQSSGGGMPFFIVSPLHPGALTIRDAFSVWGNRPMLQFLYIRGYTYSLCAARSRGAVWWILKRMLREHQLEQWFPITQLTHLINVFAGIVPTRYAICHRSNISLKVF